jgi:hypothetical protein
MNTFFIRNDCSKLYIEIKNNPFKMARIQIWVGNFFLIEFMKQKKTKLFIYSIKIDKNSLFNCVHLYLSKKDLLLSINFEIVSERA